MKTEYKMVAFYGMGTVLEEQIDRYFKEQKMAPGMIKTLTITPNKQYPLTHASISVKILHRINPDLSQKYSKCTVRVVCEDNIVNYCSVVSAIMSQATEVLWFSHEAQDAGGTHYWIGIFANT